MALKRILIEILQLLPASLHSTITDPRSVPQTAQYHNQSLCKGLHITDLVIGDQQIRKGS
jgi:hypothetical protein